MDWELVVERNTKALRRILATLVAMAGLNSGAGSGGQFTFFPQEGARSQSSGGQFTFFPPEGAQSPDQALAEKSKGLS